ncbi:MAG: tetratricopeptide repeat protein [Pirellulales bacterium]
MNFLLALLLVGAEPVAVGQMVMPKEGAVLRAGGQTIEDNGKTGVPYQVQQIRDPWYLVHGSASGWIKQSDVVPLAAAPAYYTPLIESRPTEWLFRMRGVARNNLGEYDQAIADLTAAIELQPTEAALNQRGEAWRMKREYDRAIEDYDEAVRRDPQMTLAFANRGIAWRAKGDLDRALADFDEALRLAPYYTRVLCSRASLWGAKGDPDRAIADYGQALRYDPKNVPAYSGRSYAWRTKREFDRALDDCDQAILLEPGKARHWIDHGTLLAEKEEFDAGIVSLTEAIRLNPSDFQAFTFRGYTLMRKGDYAGAAVDLEQALRLAPQESLNAAVFAWLLATCPEESRRDGPRALALATQACDLTQHKSAPCLEALAAAHAELGNFEEAVRWQEQAVELDKTHKDLEEEESRLELYRTKQPFREKPAGATEMPPT